jgi:hypothetical protein
MMARSSLARRILGPTVVASNFLFSFTATGERFHSASAASLGKTNLSKSFYNLLESFAKQLVLQKTLMAAAAAPTTSLGFPAAAAAAAPAAASQNQEKESFVTMISIITASNEEAMLLGEGVTESVSFEEENCGKNDIGVISSSMHQDQQQAWKIIPKNITVEGVPLEACKKIPLLPLASGQDKEEDGEYRPAITNTSCLLYRNGHGIRTLRVPLYGDVHVYVVALYTEYPIHSEQEFVEYIHNSNEEEDNAHQETTSNNRPSVVMEFTFLQNVSPSQMSIAWNYQLDASVTFNSYEGYSYDKATFLELLLHGDEMMAHGGKILFEFVGDRLQITKEGSVVGEIKGKNFQRAFGSMWFGERPVTEALKEGLLNEKNIHHDAMVAL